MNNFWDERFKLEEYIYGVEPNRFYEEALAKLGIKGDILFPAEGEGRNAVFAATKGLNVTAFDLSIEGKKKALKLASENNVEINYLVGEFEGLGLKENSFDAIVLVFAHFHPSIRQNFHRAFSKLLKKDGVLILEGFSTNNLELKNINGPKNLEMLFSIDIIAADFAELESIELTETIANIDEGSYHKGKSSLIRFIGRKVD